MCRLVTNLAKLQIQLPNYSCIVYYIDNNTTNRMHPYKRIIFNLTSMYHRRKLTYRTIFFRFSNSSGMRDDIRSKG